MTVEWLGDWVVSKPVSLVPAATGQSASRRARIDGADGFVDVTSGGMVVVAGKPFQFDRANTSLSEMEAGLPRITAWVGAGCPKWQDEVSQ